MSSIKGIQQAFVLIPLFFLTDHKMTSSQINLGRAILLELANSSPVSVWYSIAADVYLREDGYTFPRGLLSIFEPILHHHYFPDLHPFVINVLVLIFNAVHALKRGVFLHNARSYSIKNYYKSILYHLFW